MSDRSFQASHWFKAGFSEPAPEVRPRVFESDLFGSLEKSRADLQHDQNTRLHQATTPNFNPKKHVISQWSANALLSKFGHEIKSVINLLQIDVEARFYEFKKAPRSFQAPIYEEYLDFCNDFEIEKLGHRDHNEFWTDLHGHNANFPHTIEEYRKNYFSKVALTFFAKLRLLEILSRESIAPIDERHLINPSLFFGYVFTRGSSKELKTKALGQNHFSWYRPSAGLALKLRSLIKNLAQIEDSELFKIIAQEIERLSNNRHSFSHALSHTAFGNFVNSLLLSFPDWIEFQNNEKAGTPPQIPGALPQVVTCKMTGDYLPALYQSYWLSQSQSLESERRKMLCPDFREEVSRKASFLSVQFELQFLCYLGKTASNLGQPISQFICDMANKKESQIAQTLSGQQTSFFEKDIIGGTSSYQRILLNLVDFPKRNPHHFLVNQISGQTSQLAAGGFLIVISSQKFFVPSQKERTEQLLSELEIVGCFTSKELFGKGKIGSYIYVFKKRTRKRDYNPKEKSHCLSFIFSGELQTVHEFSQIVYELELFYQKQSEALPPLFSKSIGENLKLEFFQDSVMEGRLVNFAQKDQNKITHPRFYNNVLKSYVPIDRCFSIRSLQTSEGTSLQTGQAGLASRTFGTRFNEVGDFPYILIIDQRAPKKTYIEIISSEIYPSKLDEYGKSYCSYFGLLPKIKNINPLLFREFFHSPIGEQLVDLTFSGNNTKLKGRLEGLLVPHFFTLEKEVPDFIKKAVQLLEASPNNLYQMTADQLKGEFDQLEGHLAAIQNKYPYFVADRLSKFKANVEICLSQLEQEQDSLLFSSPIVREKLVQLSGQNVFPNNQDVFVDFKLSSKSDLNLPVEKVELIKEQTVFLKLESNHRELVRLHGDETLLRFLKFVCSQIQGIAVGELLKGLRVPSANELKKVLELNQSFMRTTHNLHTSSTEIIRVLFSTHFQ